MVRRSLPDHQAMFRVSPPWARTLPFPASLRKSPSPLSPNLGGEIEEGILRPRRSGDDLGERKKTGICHEPNW